jgi:Novel toxin 10
MDNELKGEGNSLNYEYRMHDPRVGRFFAVDPLFKEYPHYTPYSFSGNKVIASIELEGLEDVWVADGSKIVKKVGPYVGAYTSEQAANNRFLEATARKPKVARPQAEIRSDDLDAQVNKFRGVNPGLAISRGVIDGFQEAPMVILPEIAIAKAVKVYKAFKQAKIAVKAANALRNPVPATVARVIPADINPKTLGLLKDPEVFVTAPEDIKGLNAVEIANKLTIPESKSGFKIIEFKTPEGISSPFKSDKPGFIGNGETLGGAREFVIPNQTIPSSATTTTVK